MKLTTPNKLIIVRMFLALTIFALLMTSHLLYGPVAYDQIYTKDLMTVNILNWVAFSLFILAAFTDWLDGHLARKNDQVTDFGKLFDPIADKFIINMTLIMFAVMMRVPVWMVVLFIARDLYIDGMRMMAIKKGIVLEANFSGKLKTTFQFIGIALLFVVYSIPAANTANFNYQTIESLAVIPLGIALSISLFSMFDYTRKHFKEIIK